MATKVIDLSGRQGLVTKHQGDLNDTADQPHLRYLGAEGQMASGIWNPLKKYGYISAANNSYTAATGTITARLVAGVYDYPNDDLYLAENGPVLSRMDGLDDTSLTAVTTGLTADFDIDDLEIYEVAGTRILAYATSSSDYDDGVDIGFLGLDSNSGLRWREALVVDGGIDSSEEPFLTGGNTKLAQKILHTDVSGAIDRIRIRLGRLGVDNDYTVKIGFQGDSGGYPDGTYTISTTFDPSVIPVSTTASTGVDIYVDIASTTLSTTTWLVIEPVDPDDIDATNGFSWWRSANNKSAYANGEAAQYTPSTWSDAAGTSESFDFSLISSSLTAWTPFYSSGEVYSFEKADFTNFIRKADNALLYWFTDNRVHSVDGSITGGNFGTINPNLLIFPKHLNAVDAVDTNGFMYIAIQSTQAGGGSADTKTFPADTIGVYVWDRQSTVVRTRDYAPIYGAKEIKRLFVDNEGTVNAIVINNSRFCELRQYINGKFVIVAGFELDGYPPYRHSVTRLGSLTAWQGQNGTIYGWGKLTPQESNQIYKLGDISGEASGTFTPGIMVAGHNEATEPRLGAFLSWADDSTQKLSKWFPNGEGTIGSTVQNPHQGDIYSLVTPLKYTSTVENIKLLMIPGTNAGATTVANVKIYFNQSSTAWATKAITLDDIKRGWKEIEVNMQNINFVQIELEYVTTRTLGTDDFNPMYAEVNYQPTNTK